MKKVFALLLCLIAVPASAQQLNIAVTPLHSVSQESSHIFKAAPGRLYQISGSNGTVTAGFMMVFDSATVPSTGAVTPVLCRALPASGTVVIDFIPTPSAQFSNGIVATVSSGANCSTYTTGTITAWFDAILQ